MSNYKSIIERVFRTAHFAWSVAGIVCFVCAASIAGHVFDYKLLRGEWFGLPALQPSTAIWLFAISINLPGIHHRTQKEFAPRLGSPLETAWRILLASPSVIGLLIIVFTLYLNSYSLAPEQPSKTAWDLAARLIRTSPHSIIGLGTVSISIFLFASRRSWAHRILTGLLGSSFYSLCLMSVGYLLPTGSVIRLDNQPEIGISPLTWVLLTILCSALFGLAVYDRRFYESYFPLPLPNTARQFRRIAFGLFGILVIVIYFVGSGTFDVISSLAIVILIFGTTMIGGTIWFSDLLFIQAKETEGERLRLQTELLASEQKVNELRIEELNERFRHVFESSPIGKLLVDAAGTIVLANPQALKVFEYESKDLLGQKVEVLIPARLRQNHVSFREAYSLNPETRQMGSNRDLVGLSSRGEEIAIEVQLAPLTIDGKRHVLAALIDIRERLESQRSLEASNSQFQEANRDLESFAFAASHDLRAPMRAIDQLSSWLLEDLQDVAPPESKKHLRLLMSRVERMEKLLDDMLAFARHRGEACEQEEVSLPDLTRDLLRLVDVNNSFELETDFEIERFATVRVPLEQCLRNLISNAVKHHEAPNGLITVRCRKRNGRLVFQVADDGPGIPPEFRKRIFEAFTTLKPRDQREGSGIGLAMTRTIITRYGGTISVVDSEQGTCFEFDWPYEEMSETSSTEE